MKRIETSIPGVCLVEPAVHRDERGFFLESYNAKAFEAAGIRDRFVQDNHSRSSRGVVRGLHYQLGRPQAKLVRVLSGEIYDVAVDVRRGSPTFGKWVGQRLNAEDFRMLYVPVGFAHGFAVISDTAEFFYKCSDFYSPADERGVAWDDPDLAIPWPLEGTAPRLSARDRNWRPLREAAEKDLPVYA